MYVKKSSSLKKPSSKRFIILVAIAVLLLASFATLKIIAAKNSAEAIQQANVEQANAIAGPLGWSEATTPECDPLTEDCQETVVYRAFVSTMEETVETGCEVALKWANTVSDENQKKCVDTMVAAGAVLPSTDPSDDSVPEGLPDVPSESTEPSPDEPDKPEYTLTDTASLSYHSGSYAIIVTVGTATEQPE